MLVKNKLGIPKYKQIIDCIEKAIETNTLKKDEKLPSVTKMCLTNSLSRDTVLQAYSELKKRGIIYAILGKGYYVKSTEIERKLRIFLLFDELNSFKEDLYNSFLKTVGSAAEVDIFFHHFNPNVFRKLLQDNAENYTHYVLMPTHLAVADSIKTLPVKSVYILDQTNEDLSKYPAVYQNFVKDMYNGLFQGKEKLRKYQKLILLYPGEKEPEGMKIGFEKFCQEFHFEYEILSQFDSQNIPKGVVYIIPNDRDLVKVIEQSKQQKWQLGVDFGIISYNETPLKKIVENGITTLSTDFEKMGKEMAKMVLNNQKKQIENKSKLLLRNSL